MPEMQENGLSLKNAGAETNNAPGSNPAMRAPRNPAHAKRIRKIEKRDAICNGGLMAAKRTSGLEDVES